MADPTPVLTWLNPSTGNYDAFDPTNITQMDTLNNAYYQINFADAAGTIVYVKMLLGSLDGLTENTAVTQPEIAAVIARYNAKQAAIVALQQTGG